MKHHFAPWSEDTSNLGGFAKLAIEPGDAHSHCTRCGVKVKVAARQSTTKFWIDGKWTTKRPPCEEKTT